MGVYELLRMGAGATAALSAVTARLLGEDPFSGLAAAGFNAYGA